MSYGGYGELHISLAHPTSSSPPLTPSPLQQAVAVAVATVVEVRPTAVELAVMAVAMAVAAAATVRLRTIRGLPGGPTVGCHRQRTR